MGTALACTQGRRIAMMFMIAAVLVVLWVLGLVSGYTLGNFIYVFLVIALVLFVIGLPMTFPLSTLKKMLIS